MLELDVLKTSEILELLNFFLGHERVEKEIEFAIKICEWVGHLPLGIELVGRYLALEQFSLREALERLNQERLNSNILNEVDTMMNNQSNLRSAFNLSWERLDENAQELGCILSLFALAEIPPQLLEMVSSYLVDQNATQTFDWEKRRRDLLKSSLLSRNSNGYYLHQLIREFLKEKLDSSEQNNKIKSAFTRAMISIAKQLLYDIPGRTTLENILAWSKKIPHLVEVSQNLIYFVSDENLSDCFESIGLFYDGQGLYQQAQSIYEGYLRVTQQRFGNEDIRVANAFDLLGRLHHARGNYSGAESLLKQSLDIRRFCFGNVHLTVAQSLNNLAGVYDAQRRYKEAEELLFLALEQRKQLLGNNNIDVALTMSNLAKIYESQERYEEARVLHERALYMRRKLLGERHLHTVLSIHNLAQVYNLLGQYEESERLHLQALELRREILGLDHPDVAQSLNNIAGLYRNCGRDDEAETMLREALEICERRLGAEHPRILVVRENLVNPRQTRYLGLAH
jgi:tetratricopeptide (TPR) repeat protein